MDYNIKDVSGRLKSTREYLDISVGEMANKTNVTTDEYISLENGEKDFSLSFLNQAADALGIELIELLTGVTPKLNTYSIVRKDQGLPIEFLEFFAYQYFVYFLKNIIIVLLLVIVPYYYVYHKMPIHLSVHDGQEMDYIISGTLKFQIGSHIETVSEGDCIYYDSMNPHGMIAVDGKDCKFLAILI